MNVQILDFNPPHISPVNRSQTGAFGLAFRPQTLRGKLIQQLKKKSISLPSIHSGYIASLLHQKGHSIHYGHIIEDTQYDVVIFHATMPGYQDEIQALRILKEKYPNTKVIIWGTFPTTYPQFYLHYCNYLVKGGEPENGFIKLIESEFDQTEQIIESTSVEDLNILPTPYWLPFSPHNFRFTPFLKGNSVIPFSFSRGCYFNCSYCHYMPNVGAKERRLQVKNAVEQIQSSIELYSTHHFYFRDLVFTSNTTYILSVFEQLREHNIHLEWACETRSDCLTEPLIDQLKEYGLKHINLGIESADPKTLKKAGRHAPQIEHQEKMIRYAEKNGITIAAFYILGFPNQTLQEIQDTIAYSYKLNTLAAQFCIYTPYPGTSAFKKEYEQTSWKQFSGFDPTIQNPHIHLFLKKTVDNSIFNYLFRFQWLWKHWRNL